eukprot:10399622-Heterocapsa_arctica.AAC.1
MPLVGLPLVPLPGPARDPVEDSNLLTWSSQTPLHLTLEGLEDGVLKPPDVAREAYREEVVSMYDQPDPLVHEHGRAGSSPLEPQLL